MNLHIAPQEGYFPLTLIEVSAFRNKGPDYRN